MLIQSVWVSSAEGYWLSQGVDIYRLVKYSRASIFGSSSGTSNIAPRCFFNKMPPHGYPGVLRPRDRIFFMDPKHDIPRHGLPTCFALIVKIRLRTLSRSVSCAGRRCIIFPPALAKLACTESRITDIRHCCVRKVEPLSFLLLLFLLPSPCSLWSIPALRYNGKNTLQYSIALLALQLENFVEFSLIQIGVLKKYTVFRERCFSRQ